MPQPTCARAQENFYMQGSKRLSLQALSLAPMPPNHGGIQVYSKAACLVIKVHAQWHLVAALNREVCT